MYTSMTETTDVWGTIDLPYLLWQSLYTDCYLVLDLVSVPLTKLRASWCLTTKNCHVDETDPLASLLHKPHWTLLLSKLESKDSQANSFFSFFFFIASNNPTLHQKKKGISTLSYLLTSWESLSGKKGYFLYVVDNVYDMNLPELNTKWKKKWGNLENFPSRQLP